jgi:hypothetical protein
MEQRSPTINAEDPDSMREKTMTIPAVPIAHIRLGALVALGLAAFFIGWLVMNRGSDETAPAAGSGAAATSESELRSFAETAPHPIYWTGPKDGYTYELTRTTDGRVYVRYLPEGTEVGDERSRFLTVGTYPRARAFAELQRAARAKGAVSLKLERGGLAVFSEARPTSVYFGYSDARYQVEVYHPSPTEARRLALSGQVVPVR